MIRWSIIKYDNDMSYLYGENIIKNTIIKRDIKQNIKYACFDLDQTLITPKSGNKFPIDSDDWRWMYDNVVSTLSSYSKKGYMIIIVTNQAGIRSSTKELDIFKSKIQKIANIFSEHGIYFRIYCATHKNVFRKPFPTMLENLTVPKNMNDASFDFKHSFFCGDGAGRENDHTDADIKFANNLGIKFYVPETIFLGKEQTDNIVKYNIIPYDKNLLSVSYTYKENTLKRPELIIMYGLPASGKSYTAHTILEYFAVNCSRNSYSWVYINLDEIKNKTKMINLIKYAAKEKKHIIVDNTNIDIATRSELINMVKKINDIYYVRIVAMNTSLDRCKHNNNYRFYKTRNDPNPKYIPDIVYNMMKKKNVFPNKSENNHIDTVDVVAPSIPLDISYLYLF